MALLTRTDPAGSQPPRSAPRPTVEEMSSTRQQPGPSAPQRRPLSKPTSTKTGQPTRQGQSQSQTSPGKATSPSQKLLLPDPPEGDIWELDDPFAAAAARGADHGLIFARSVQDPYWERCLQQVEQVSTWLGQHKLSAARVLMARRFGPGPWRASGPTPRFRTSRDAAVGLDSCC